MAVTNRNRLLEKYVEVVRMDGLNTNKNVNIGTAAGGSTATLSVGTGGIATTGAANFNEPVVAIPAASAAFSPTAAQSSAWFTLNPSTAQTITLPAPVVGLTYTFVVQTAATGSNTLKWITNTGTVFMQGTDIIATVGGASSIFQGNGSTHVSFNCNGTTTGGLIGTTVTFTCLTATSWQVTAQNFGSGTLATSFGTS